jgi:hypothetical protein
VTTSARELDTQALEARVTTSTIVKTNLSTALTAYAVAVGFHVKRSEDSILQEHRTTVLPVSQSDGEKLRTPLNEISISSHCTVETMSAPTSL